jgi:N-methylhydantoinase A
LPAPGQAQPGTLAPVTGKRTVITNGASMETRVYRRDELLGGHVLTGPALADQSDATVYLPPGWSGVVHASGSLIVSEE